LRRGLNANKQWGVDISALQEGLSAFNLIDVNLTKADYFYRVCVKNSQSGEELCSDPGAENYGNY